MNRKFCVGDVVRLNSGGPEMMVSCVNEVSSGVYLVGVEWQSSYQDGLMELNQDCLTLVHKALDFDEAVIRMKKYSEKTYPDYLRLLRKRM